MHCCGDISQRQRVEPGVRNGVLQQQRNSFLATGCCSSFRYRRCPSFRPSPNLCPLTQQKLADLRAVPAPRSQEQRTHAIGIDILHLGRRSDGQQ